MKHYKLLTILLALAFVFVLAGAAQQKSDETAIDPVCGMTVNKAQAKATYEYKDTTYYFCNPGCKEAFAKDPEKYLQKQAAGDQAGMMKHGQGGQMMHPQMCGEKMKAGGCPMMQGEASKGCCGMMMGKEMMGHGMMAGGCCADCPMMDKEVEKKVENTSDGVTVKITSKNPETVKKIQEHVAKMGECCAKMTEGCTMMKKTQQEAPKAEKK